MINHTCVFDNLILRVHYLIYQIVSCFLMESSWIICFLQQSIGYINTFSQSYLIGQWYKSWIGRRFINISLSCMVDWSNFWSCIFNEGIGSVLIVDFVVGLLNFQRVIAVDFRIQNYERVSVWRSLFLSLRKDFLM